MNAIDAIKLLPLTLWLRRFRRFTAKLCTHRAHAAAACAEAATAEEQEAPRGCGWFDSSHDLQRGLRVQEHLSADTLARELPLSAWLDLQLSGWRAATPAAAQPAFTHAT